MPAPHLTQRRALAGLAIGALDAVGVLAGAALAATLAAGLYTETTRVPDQP